MQKQSSLLFPESTFAYLKRYGLFLYDPETVKDKNKPCQESKNETKKENEAKNLDQTRAIKKPTYKPKAEKYNYLKNFFRGARLAAMNQKEILWRKFISNKNSGNQLLIDDEELENFHFIGDDLEYKNYKKCLANLISHEKNLHDLFKLYRQQKTKTFFAFLQTFNPGSTFYKTHKLLSDQLLDYRLQLISLKRASYTLLEEINSFALRKSDLECFLKNFLKKSGNGQEIIKQRRSHLLVKLRSFLSEKKLISNQKGSTFLTISSNEKTIIGLETLANKLHDVYDPKKIVNQLKRGIAHIDEALSTFHSCFPVHDLLYGGNYNRYHGLWQMNEYMARNLISMGKSEKVISARFITSLSNIILWPIKIIANLLLTIPALLLHVLGREGGFRAAKSMLNIRQSAKNPYLDCSLARSEQSLARYYGGNTAARRLINLLLNPINLLIELLSVVTRDLALLGYLLLGETLGKFFSNLIYYTTTLFLFTPLRYLSVLFDFLILKPIEMTINLLLSFGQLILNIFIPYDIEPDNTYGFSEEKQSKIPQALPNQTQEEKQHSQENGNPKNLNSSQQENIYFSDRCIAMNFTFFKEKPTNPTIPNPPLPSKNLVSTI